MSADALFSPLSDHLGGGGDGGTEGVLEKMGQLERERERVRSVRKGDKIERDRDREERE